MVIYKKSHLSKGLQLFIQRFFNDKFLIGVTGVIFNNKKQVLLFKHTYRRVEWSLPGGYMKAKEHPKEGLRREIEEESGLRVKILKIITSKNDVDAARMDLSYYGKFLGGKFKPSSEVIECGFFSRSKLPPLIKDQYKQIEVAYGRYKTPWLENFRSFFEKNVVVKH